MITLNKFLKTVCSQKLKYFWNPRNFVSCGVVDGIRCKATMAWPGERLASRALVILLLFFIILIPNVFAANDPGHDSLYIEQNGNSQISGDLNITQYLRVNQRFSQDYLQLQGNGTTYVPTYSAIFGTAGAMYIDSANSIRINSLAGTTETVYFGYGAAQDVNVNITGNLLVDGAITKNGVNVCLSNGTNCVTGNNSGNVSSIIAGNGISVDQSIGDVTVSVSATTCGAGEYSYWTGSAFSCRTDSSGTGSLWTNSSGNATFTSGNVGIGTTSPTTNLEVKEPLSNGWLSMIKGYAITEGDIVGLKLNLGYNGEYNKWAGVAAVSEYTAANKIGMAFYTGTSSGGSTEKVRIDAYGNVGIGTSTPSQKLDVNGSINISDSAGKIHTPELCLAGDCQTSWPSGGTSLWTNSSGNATFTSGNVGIGTSSPGASLDVFGDRLQITNEADDAQFRVNVFADGTGTATSPKGVFSRSGGTVAIPTAILDGFYLGLTNYNGYDGVTTWTSARQGVLADGDWNSTNHGIKWVFEGIPNGSTVKAEWMTLKDGMLGIGTTNPGSKLHVKGTLEIENPSTDSYIHNNIIRNRDSTNNRVVFENDGGAGTESFGFIVSPGGATSDQQTNINLWSKNVDINNTDYTVGGIVLGTNGNLDFRLSTLTGGAILGVQNITFTINNTEKMRITNSGNIGLGNTTPQSKLVVQGNITPGANNTYSLGTPDLVWKDVHVGPGSLYVGGVALSNVGGELQWGGSAISGTGSLWTNSSNNATYSAGNVGIGTTTPDGTLHVNTATAGSITPGSNVDDLIVENSADGGISILTPDASIGILNFGNPSDVAAAQARYQHSIATLKVGTYTPGGTTQLLYDNGVVGLTVNGSTGNVGIGTTSPTVALDVVGKVSMTDDLIVDRSAYADHALAVFRSATGKIAGQYFTTAASTRWFFGKDGATESGSNVGSDFYIQRFNDAGTVIDQPFNIQRSTGYVGIGTTSPSSALHVNGTVTVESGSSDHTIADSSGDLVIKAASGGNVVIELG